MKWEKCKSCGIRFDSIHDLCCWEYEDCKKCCIHSLKFDYDY